MKKTLETVNASGSTAEMVGKYSGLALGVLGGLEMAGLAETVFGKIFSVVGGAFLGGWAGKKAGQALS